MSAETDGRRFAYASGYTPLPDRKTFIPEIARERHEEFTRISGFKPGIHIGDFGSKWPDFLMNGGGYVSQFVSERVISALEREGVEILDITEFPIESIAGCRAKLADAPRYFVLEAPPELVPDWRAMNVPINVDGKPILRPYPKPWPPRPFIYRKDTWSGRDLVSEHPRTMVCGTTKLFVSDRIRQMAEKEKWSNVMFEGIGFHSNPNL
ncbi:hypothetical protein FEM03_05285 [Phragmitibacter flavus]|uniref:Uncharacterized protein n=1 Tax=Phragmitibacter flavus TaxID=2576071 RepID=A0A5R8KGX4_9BACT|nr:hypothetical protein [Phragmitibacter flavus]TLD71558.1 hypothetical protein FEM03_05285 [Phragmitibacter flavus]